MTVYNGLPFVVDAVRSVLDQRDVDLELVLVDDGSTDGTVAALQQFSGDPRLLLFPRPHEGRVPALNYAIARARGAYIANLDADDLALPGRFRASAEFLASAPQVGAVGSACETYVAQDRAPRRLPRTDARIRWSFLLRNPMFNSSVTYRGRSLRDIGGFSMEYADRLHDADVLLRIARDYELANLPQPLSARRIHPGQHFAAVDRHRRARVNARCRIRAARELRFSPLTRPVAHVVAAMAALRSVVVLGLLGRNGRMDRQREVMVP
jgi:glycosyltransferase involved in cell wall biosynthesis